MRIQSKHYLFEWNDRKNRAFVKIFGFWEKPEDEPAFITDWEAIISRARKGFALLIDAREFLTPPQKVLKLISEVQRMSIEIGVAKRAEIVPESFISSLATQYAAKESGMWNLTRQFSSREEAEKWLDEG